jgi:hypothetical protein
MALTSSQKAQVRRYLGYPDGYRYVYTELENAMTALSAEGETLVGTILTSLALIETKLAASWDRMKVTQVEDVHFAGSGEIGALRNEGRRLATDLASLLSVRMLRVPFSSSTGNGATIRG